LKQIIKKCVGTITNTNGCKALNPVDPESKPAIIDWKYQPIWEMNVSELSEGARKNMKELIKKVYEKSIQCGKDHCNDHGVCPSSGKTTSMKDMIHDKKCICHKGFVGKTCDMKEKYEYRKNKISSVQIYYNHCDQGGVSQHVCQSRCDKDKNCKFFIYQTTPPQCMFNSASSCTPYLKFGLPPPTYAYLKL